MAPREPDEASDDEVGTERAGVRRRARRRSGEDTQTNPDAAVRAARDAAEGHEAVVVSHQLPIWVTRQALEGNRLWHDPRKRECSVASLTSLHFDGEHLSGITYSEPAGDLLPGTRQTPGA